MIMLIRHAEKPLHPSGIRAGALIELFAPSAGELRADLRRPDTIYGSAHAGGQSKRSIQTVSPLAARLGLVVITRFAAGRERDLAREISNRPGVTLVAWHHEAIQEIADNLGQVEPTPPNHWPHDRFDMIWTFTHDQNGWRFAQIPQLLLPGDLPYPIMPVLGTP
jgi:broad specificity phosphatase PhoE